MPLHLHASIIATRYVLALLNRTLAASRNGTESMNENVEHLKREVIPKLFKDTSLIGAYGSEEQSHDIDSNSDLIEESCVTELTRVLIEIKALLDGADPETISRKPNWFQRFSGQKTEARARYQHTRGLLEVKLSEARKVSNQVKARVGEMDATIAKMGSDRSVISDYIQAGQEYLAENPDVGVPDPKAFAFDKARDRFQRRLSNLAALQVAREVSNNQIQLARSVACDMLDRHEQTDGVLVKVWRQFTLDLVTSKDLRPAQIAEAVKSHEALKRSLAEALTHHSA